MIQPLSSRVAPSRERELKLREAKTRTLLLSRSLTGA